jgi:hypothetical protein
MTIISSRKPEQKGLHPHTVLASLKKSQSRLSGSASEVRSTIAVMLQSYMDLEIIEGYMTFESYGMFNIALKMKDDDQFYHAVFPI